MPKVYSYEDCQPVIKEAFNKAIEHLQETLGDQYSMNATKFAWGKFQDYVEQDIEFKMTCDLCGKIDGESEFTEVMVNSQDLINICYDCHEKSNVEDEK